MPGEDRKDPADAIRESAHQIWLAGLGAFTRAQQEGVKVFETLVKEGASASQKTQAAAEEGFAQAKSRFAGVAADIGTRAADQWNKLESLFEDRVARALERLGMPSITELAALQARVEVLEAELRQHAAGNKKPAARRASSPGKRARKTASPAAPAVKAPRQSRRTGR